jgi:hypothetical protein
VAALLRYPWLDRIPPGFNFDEAGDGAAALDVSRGIYRIWWPIGGGKEPLMAYLVQPFFWLLGPTRLALRLYTATMGVLTVGGTYWLAREMFAKTREGVKDGRLPQGRASLEGWNGGRLGSSPLPNLPTYAALGLATAFWHVAYSRIAFRALAMPAVEVLGLAWLWRALQSVEGHEGQVGRWGHFAGAGALIGLGAYTYPPGRLVPVALALFFGVESLLARRQAQRPLLARHFGGLALSTAIALLVFAPLAFFFAENPQAFFERGGAVSIFNPAWNQGDLWGTLFRTTLTTLSTFAALGGDPNPLGNLPGRPLLGPVLAPFFWLAMAVSIGVIVRQVTSRHTLTSASHIGLATPYLFLLCWWSVMLLPGILAPEGAPHHLRLIGAGPAAYILVAVGVSQTANLIYQISTHRSPSGDGKYETANSKYPWSVGQGRQIADGQIPAPLQLRVGKSASLGRLRDVPLGQLSRVLLGFVFVAIGLVTARDYFVRWVKLPQLYMAYDVYAVELVEQMEAETGPSAAYVIPMDLRARNEARHYTLDLLYRGATPYYYLPVDEPTAAAQLTEAAVGHKVLRVVRWVQDKHAAADEREVVTFLLTQAARLAGEEMYPVYRIETWELPSAGARFALPTINMPVGETFGGALRLEAADVSAQAGTVCIALRWAPMAAMDVDYKASLRLVAADGSLAAQKDRFLRHNWHQSTHLWPPETVNEYYVLPRVVPGEYEVRVVVYDPDTLAPLVMDTGAEVSLGKVRVE